jgi:hypothetical protein
MISLDFGTQPIVTAAFDPGPPTAWEIFYRLPDGTESEPTAVAVQGKNLIVTLPVLDQSGLHTIRVQGTNGAIGGEELTFYVTPSRIRAAVTVG